MTRYLYSFLLSILVDFVHGQIVFMDEPPFEKDEMVNKIHEQTLSVLDSFKNLSIAVRESRIFDLNGRLYLVLDGRLDLFEWRNTGWGDISMSEYHGYNFFSKKFCYKGDLYSFGGYGFWREHGELIRFDWDSKEWESVLLLTGEKMGNGESFVRDGFLYVINPVSRNQHFGSRIAHDGWRRINLATREVDVLPAEQELHHLKSDIRLETQNYYLPSRDPFQIIDKKNMKFRFTDINQLIGMAGYTERTFFQIHGDSISMWNNDSKDDAVHFDLDAVYKKAPFHERNLIRSNGYLLPVGALSILSALAGMWYFKRKKSRQAEKAYDHPLIFKLLSHSGDTITQEQLDALFGIEKIVPAETQRSKRSSIYKELNHEYQKEHGAPLITRVQDPLDGRRFLYKIT